MLRKAVLIMCIIVMLLAANNVFADNEHLVFLGGQLGGVWEIHGAAMVEVIKREYPDILIDFRPGGGVSNITNISRGEGDLGMSQSVVAKSAQLGIEPYEDEKHPNIRAICSTYSSRDQYITKTDSGINSLDQIIKEKLPVRISVGNRGSATSLQVRRTLEAYGVTFDEIESWGGKIYFKQMTEAATLMSAGRLDIQFDGGSIPLPVFKQLETTLKLKMLPVDNEDARDLMSNNFGYIKTFIPKGSYTFVNEDVPTLGVMTVIVVSESLSSDVVYKITKAIAENLDYLHTADVGLKVMTRESMCRDTGVELHPGAEKYYKEVGLLK